MNDHVVELTRSTAAVRVRCAVAEVTSTDRAPSDLWMIARAPSYSSGSTRGPALDHLQTRVGRGASAPGRQQFKPPVSHNRHQSG